MNFEHQKTFFILAHTAVLGGSSRSLSLVVRHLAQAGSRVVIFSPQGPAWSAWKSSGAEIILWDPPSCNWLGVSVYSTYAFESSWDRFLFNFSDLVLLPVRLWKAKKLLFRTVSNQSVSAIYVNTLALFPLAGTLGRLKKKSGIRVLWQIREVLNEKLFGILYRAIAKNIAIASDQIIAISSNEAKAFNPLKPVEVLYNSVSPDWNSVNEQPISHGISHKRRIAMSGAYRPSKGVADFIKMAEIVKRKYPDVEFYLYSPHPIPPRYRSLFGLARRFLEIFSEKMSISLDLVENLTAGVIKNCVNVVFDQPLSLDTYHNMTIYVRSDRSGSPWGRDVIESMWAGVPVVATGSSQEFILDGKTGFLVLPGNPEAIADCVSRMLADRELLQKMSSTSIDRARLLFDPHKYGQRLIKIFEVDRPSTK